MRLKTWQWAALAVGAWWLYRQNRTRIEEVVTPAIKKRPYAPALNPIN